MGTNDAREKGKKSADGQSRKVGKSDDAEFVGYINVNLSDAQKEAFPAWAESASLWDTLQGEVERGVNLSLKRSLKEECFIASATQRDSSSVNAGLCVTARGSDPFKALGRLLFILAYLSQHEKWTDTQPVANPDRW